MARFEIIKWGDREGIGAVVKKKYLFWTSTWTGNDDSSMFGKWVCRETGEFVFKDGVCPIDHFYKAQFDTQN